MQHLVRRTWATGLMVVLTLLTACGAGDQITNVSTLVIVGIGATPSSTGEFTLSSGDGCTKTLQLQASTASKWESQNPNIATVDQNGLITAVAGASGRVTINVTPLSGSGTKQVVINVVNSACVTITPPSNASVSFTPHGGGYPVGSQTTLTLTCTNVSCPTPYWFSNQPSIATVVSTGNSKATVTCISAGVARIFVQAAQGTVTSANPSDFADFTCTAAGSGVTGVSVSPNGSTLNLTGTNGVCVAGTVTFSATVSPVNTVSQAVTWSSSGGSITQGGVFTTATAGTYTITAKSVADQNVVGTATLNVVANCGTPVTGTVTSSLTTLSVVNCSGFVSSYAPGLSFNNAPITGTWTSSNTGVAVATSNGFTLTGTAGTANITATTSQGSVTIPVTVTACAVSTGTLQPTGIQTINSGQSCANTSITYTSDLPISSATATPTGIVTVTQIASNQITVTSIAGQAGTVVITANVTGGTRTATLNVTNASCVQNGVTSVTVTPPTAAMQLGQFQNFTATVNTTGTGVSTCVTWTTSNPTRVVLTNTNTNIVTAEARAVGVDTVFATSCADVSKRGFAVVTVTSGASSCTWANANGSTVYNAYVVNTPFNSTASCVYQGSPQQPYHYSTAPDRFTVVGAPFVCVIGGLGYPCGTNATIKPIAVGTADYCVQAAVQDPTVKFCRTITSVAAASGYIAYSDKPKAYEMILPTAPPKGAKVSRIYTWAEWVNIKSQQ